MISPVIGTTKIKVIIKILTHIHINKNNIFFKHKSMTTSSEGFFTYDVCRVLYL